MTLQLLIAGHIVKDIHNDGWTPGGGALYAAAQASRLGIETAVVTACDREIDPAALVPGVEWRVRPLERGIEFENTYLQGARSQRVLSHAAPVGLEDIPEDWRPAPTILLTPVLHDVDEALPGALAGTGVLTGIGAQGWLRGLDGDRVLPGTIEPEPAWLQGNVVFLSEEDALDPESAEAWLGRMEVVVLTRGRRGCTVWQAAGRHDLPPMPACEQDPTGAGDVFAAAYLVRFGETGDTLESARFAAAAAAVSVEGPGIEAIGDRSRIEARLALYGGDR